MQIAKQVESGSVKSKQAENNKADSPVIVWFRRDLRLADNPALRAAAETRRTVLPLYVRDAARESPYCLAGVAEVWNLLNAKKLDTDLASRFGSRLILRAGNPAEEVLRLAAEVSARAVFVNSLSEPEPEAADLEFRAEAQRQGIKIDLHQANLLTAPGTLTTGDGGQYKVFTPFHRQFLRQYRHAPPRPAPSSLAHPPDWPSSLDWSAETAGTGIEYRAVAEHWPAGSRAAFAQLEQFVNGNLATYGDDRDQLGRLATSALSPYLQCGAISARQVWDAVARSASEAGTPGAESAHAFQRQLVWREFCYHILAYYPDLAAKPYRSEFSAFPWRPDTEQLARWQAGKTGYPVVDAAMRQLAATGWMPGRVRMVVASFLAKHLLQDWRAGEQWFRQRLIDADLACNAFNWQWVAGCGFDAAPYFRIFNPVTQGTKFDPEGHYVSRWVPELAGLPPKYIHSPWTAPAGILDAAGIRLGHKYPLPVVDHREARERALSAYYALKTS